jgi:hypothetical protein
MQARWQGDGHRCCATARKGSCLRPIRKTTDPSHVHALTFPEMAAIIVASGLSNVRTAQYKVEGELEQLLSASFPNSGEVEKIREMFKSDVELDQMGINVHQRGNEIHFAVPILVVVCEKIA